MDLSVLDQILYTWGATLLLSEGDPTYERSLPWFLDRKAATVLQIAESDPFKLAGVVEEYVRTEKHAYGLVDYVLSVMRQADERSVV